MSQWTHAQCNLCWDKANPNREPFVINGAVLEDCCFCGEQTRSGIYVRHDPNTLPNCSQLHS